MTLREDGFFKVVFWRAVKGAWGTVAKAIVGLRRTVGRKGGKWEIPVEEE